MEILKREVDIYYKIWDQVAKPKGMLQIFHGMVEHIGRYDNFAKFLNENGIIVYGMDIRGHGQTGVHSDLGYFSMANGWTKVLEDQRALFYIIKEKYPGLPMYLLGHSMGSFFARNYINLYPEDFDKAILMGTGRADDRSYGIARALLKVLNPMKEASLMNSMAFGSYNKSIEDPKTDYDWLSTDSDQVNKYIDDPYCGFLVKNSFYRDFMDGMKEIANLERNPVYKRPILFISGKSDPVGAMGDFVKKSSEIYGQAELILYPGMRHEILNEVENLRVYQDILVWIDK